jgi:hypothetical protein
VESPREFVYTYSLILGLDPNNVNDGSNGVYTVAELDSLTTEKPYPNAEWNNPPGGAINYTTTPPST